MRQAGILLASVVYRANTVLGTLVQVAALLFVKASKTGFKLWQILPVNPAWLR